MLVFQVSLDFSELRLVERRLRNVDVATLDELRHLPVEEREQKRADMGTVHVRVRHDDDPVVSQLVGVVFILAKTAAQGRNQRRDLCRRDEFLESCLLDVQNFSLQWKNGLKFPVASLLRGSARRVALDEIKLTLGRVALLTVRQFSGQAHPV